MHLLHHGGECWRERMGIEPTFQLVTRTTGLKPGEPTRSPSVPVIGAFADLAFAYPLACAGFSCRGRPLPFMPRLALAAGLIPNISAGLPRRATRPSSSPEVQVVAGFCPASPLRPDADGALETYRYPFEPASHGLAATAERSKDWSGQRDSNTRFPAPKAGGLAATLCPETRAPLHSRTTAMIRYPRFGSPPSSIYPAEPLVKFWSACQESDLIRAVIYRQVAYKATARASGHAEDWSGWRDLNTRFPHPE